MAKGQRDFERYKQGKRLSPLHSIYANCYECNCLDGPSDCFVHTCPLYPYMPYGTKPAQKKQMKKKVDLIKDPQKDLVF